MGLKSVIDIDVNDENFRRFKDLYDKYNTALGKMPGLWKQSNKEMEAALAGAASVALAQNQLVKEIADKEKSLAAVSKTTDNSWKSIANSSGKFAKNILGATKEILKWTGIATAFGGLIGAGGLFGIDRLAASVSSGRRTALGLGTSYGSERAFALNYQRVVDPGSYLAAINDALHDQTKRYSFQALGLNERDLQGNTADIGVKLLDRAKQLVDRNPNLTGPGATQLLQASGLGNFFSVEDLNRIKGLSPQEFAALRQGYGADKTQLGLGSDTQQKWNNLYTQLGRAGQTIENVLVDGLTPLARPLGELSNSVASAIKAFLGSDTLKEWIPKLGEGIHNLGEYLGSQKFLTDMQTLAQDIGILAHSIHDALHWFSSSGDSPSSKAAAVRDQAAREAFLKKEGYHIGPDGVAVPNDPNALPWYKKLYSPFVDAYKEQRANNVGNLMYPGTSIPKIFDTQDAGIRAMSRQLLLDQNVHGQDTLRKLIYGNDNWPGYTSTDREAYLANLSKGLKLDPDARLNLNDNGQRAALMSLMTKQESGRQVATPIIVEILNNTGGNAIVQTNQAAH